MTDLTKLLNQALPYSSTYGLTAYDSQSSASIIKTYRVSPIIIERALEKVYKALKATYQDSYMILPRNGMLYVYTWDNMADQYLAYKDKLVFEMEALLELKKTEHAQMERILDVSKTMVEIHRALDPETISLLKTLIKDPHE